MGFHGSSPDVTRDDVRRLFMQSAEPPTPFTTAEVADRVGCSEKRTARLLGELADRKELQTRQTEGGTRLWWEPPAASDGTDRRSELLEFGAFVNAVKDYAIFMLDPDGTVASWNQGAKRIKGYTEPEIVGEHISTFYTETDTEAGVPTGNLEKAAAQGRVEDEGWRVRKDGSRFWANVVITAIHDVDGTLQGFTKVTRDMTEQREYEQKLRSERDLTEQILETVPVGIFVLDADREFLRANQQAKDFLGIDDAESGAASIDAWSLYDTDDELVPLEDRPWTEVIESGRPVYDFQCRAEVGDRGRRWLSINAVSLSEVRSDERGVVVSVADVTDRKERERRLEQRKTKLETELGEILGRISDAFFALDESWRFTHLNEHAAELFQRSETALYGRSFWEVFPTHADGRLEERLRRAMATQEPANFERYDDELDAWLEYNVYPSESGLSVYIHDITDRREYQRKLEESNERLEQFAYAASHDLQEPLRMVSSYLQLVDRRYGDELDDDGREYLEFAVDGADRMRRMIDGLLAYSRVETQGEPFERVDLDAVLDEVLDDLQVKIVESGAEISAETLPAVRGDRTQLHQVLQNLLENAIEYSGEESPQVHVGANREGNEWVVSVRDDGIGIDADDAERVFEVFQRLHARGEHDGTGIGLAVCERIVERHGGDIRVDSAPGEGATFSFTLPAAEDAE